jgi:hypothetical protein
VLGRRRGGWRRWLGLRATAHLGKAQGRAGGTGRRPEQAVRREMLGGAQHSGEPAWRECPMVNIGRVLGWGGAVHQRDPRDGASGLGRWPEVGWHR